MTRPAAVVVSASTRPRRSVSLTRTQTGAAPALLVASTVAVAWLLSGVSVADAARFAAFEGLYALLPGCTLYLLLSRAPCRWLRTLAIGWPLGYATEMGAFALTAALARRELFQLLPLLAAVTMVSCLIFRYHRSRRNGLDRMLRRRGDVARPKDHCLAVFALGIVVSLTVTLLLVRSFAQYPLPGHASSVAYSPDKIFDISLAADARHHWPITEPWVAGQQLHYYIGFFIHAAAISQATGIPISTVTLRLFPMMAVLLVALQLWYLGCSLGNSRWIGVMAVVLFFLPEDLSLDATRFDAFGSNLFTTFNDSPTYAFGIPFFLALLILIQGSPAWESGKAAPHFSSSRATAAKTLGSLVMVGALVLGAAVTKTMAVVDFLGGLSLFWLWRLHTAKTDRWRVYTAKTGRLLGAYFLVSLICTCVVYFSLLASDRAATLRFGPFSFIKYTIFTSILSIHSAGRLALLVCAAVIVYFCMFVPLLGAARPPRKGRDQPHFAVLSVAICASSLIACTVLDAPGDSQQYFLLYGYVALVPIAAAGVVSLWSEMPEGARGKIFRACVAMLVFGLAMAACTRIFAAAGILTSVAGSERIFGSGRVAWVIWYITLYGLVVAATVLASLRLEKYLVGAFSSRARRIVACCIPLLVTLGLVKPLGIAIPRLWRIVRHAPVATADSKDDQGITEALYQGLIWVRNHTNSGDILAVSNHYLKAPNKDPRYVYYSAFTERRVFLESWAYTPGGAYGGQPFPARLALNDLATLYGDPAALRALGRQGVDYVLIDKTHGGGAPEPGSVSRLLFRNSALDVYRLMTSSGVGRSQARSGGPRS
jgi:hypothetical protein